MRMTSAPQPSVRSARLVADLATLYHRHDDPARALALGLAALRFGDARPELCLLVASCFLRTGDAEQALAALGRLDRQAIAPTIEAAACLLEAKARHRQGDADLARGLLARAADIHRALPGGGDGAVQPRGSDG